RYSHIQNYCSTSLQWGTAVIIRSTYRFGALAALAVFAAVSQSAPAHAQRSGDGFLFGRPDAILSVYGGFARPNAHSDVFDFVTEILSVEKGDFLGGSAGAAMFIPVSSRLDVDLSATFSGRSVSSDYRLLEGDDDLPIEQETRFVRVPLLVGARYFVTPRER